jgi:hypothetical protein
MWGYFIVCNRAWRQTRKEQHQELRDYPTRTLRGDLGIYQDAFQCAKLAIRFLNRFGCFRGVTVICLFPVTASGCVH